MNILSDNEIQTVNCPPFAESITEGDIRWEKGNTHLTLLIPVEHDQSLQVTRGRSVLLPDVPSVFETVIRGARFPICV